MLPETYELATGESTKTKKKMSTKIEREGETEHTKVKMRTKTSTNMKRTVRKNEKMKRRMIMKTKMAVMVEGCMPPSIDLIDTHRSM